MDTFTLDVQDSVCRLGIQGETGFKLLDDMKKAVDASFAEKDFSLVVVDLSEVSFMDTSGLNFLIRLKNQAQSENKDLELHTPSDQVRKVLKIVQLEKYFTIVEAG